MAAADPDLEPPISNFVERLQTLFETREYGIPLLRGHCDTEQTRKRKYREVCEDLLDGPNVTMGPHGPWLDNEDSIEKPKSDYLQYHDDTINTQTARFRCKRSKSRDVLLANMGLFAKLPAELRNHIYDLAVVKTADEYEVIAQRNKCFAGPCEHGKLSTTLPGLLSACTQIRREAMPIYFAGNQFLFGESMVRCRCASSFLCAIGPYSDMIRIIVFEVQIDDFAEISSTWSREIGQIKLEFLVDGDGVFRMVVDEKVRVKANAQIDQLEHHLATLSDALRRRLRPRGDAIAEFASSDCMADIVFLCSRYSSRNSR